MRFRLAEKGDGYIGENPNKDSEPGIIKFKVIN